MNKIIRIFGGILLWILNFPYLNIRGEQYKQEIKGLK